MKRIVLGIQYDGRPWLGWQSQPCGQTVQDTLEHAVRQIALHPVKVACAGRTDAGVHALEQIGHFDTQSLRPTNSWVRGVNAHLPESIAVRWAVDAEHHSEYAASGVPAEGDSGADSAVDLASSHSPEFHSRFSAMARTYHYVLHNHPVRSPLLAGRAGWVFRPLNENAMRIAAEYLLGEHDFSAFRASSCQAKTPVKHLYSITVTRRGDFIFLTLRANAFLHHMVRNIVGSLISVGVGNRSPEWMQEILAGADRHYAAPTFMPDGLYLSRVDYDPKWGLPQQATDDNWFV